jgi:hypothetical protein
MLFIAAPLDQSEHLPGGGTEAIGEHAEPPAALAAKACRFSSYAPAAELV